MPKQLLVRNVPPQLAEWIERERSEHGMTQQEFTLALLENARQRDEENQIPLFAARARQVVERPVPGTLPFKFVDLFAGIGGFRIALESLGGHCVFTSEWDKYSQKTYKSWFGDTPHGDLRQIEPASIPDHDVLAAGFPCQPFSIAGVSKKKSLGRKHGFDCDAQGNLFFDLAGIIKVKRPPVLFLENVKNLQSHDGGRTWQVIETTLESDLGYAVFHKVIDAAAWVPQHRERIYLVCFDRKVFGPAPRFRFPQAPASKPRLSSVLEEPVDKRYTLSTHLWSYLQKYAEKHRAKGNGFGFGLADLNGTTRTLSARYHKDGSEILIPQARGNPRRLTPRECARLMGFDPDAYPIVVSDTQAYRQFGNAVVPPVVAAIGTEIVRLIGTHLAASGDACLVKRKQR